jgi:hypothetical protein
MGVRHGHQHGAFFGLKDFLAALQGVEQDLGADQGTMDGERGFAEGFKTWLHKVNAPASRGSQGMEGAGTKVVSSALKYSQFIFKSTRNYRKPGYKKNAKFLTSAFGHDNNTRKAHPDTVQGAGMFLDDDGLHSLMGLDESMEQFMHRYVNSFIKWELVNYFHEHPQTPYKLQDLSKALNRPADQIKRELQELVDEGFLQSIKNAKKNEYAFNLSPEHADQRRLLDLTNQFVHLCRNREGRLRVIYKILKNGKPIVS